MAFNKRYAARRIQRAYRAYGARRGMMLAGRKRRGIYRSALTKSPEPMFVETFRSGRAINVPAGGGVGEAFKVRFSDIPQWLQYTALYTQYRINWVKVMLIPNWNTSASDVNTGELASVVPTNYAGLARIAYAIQDSPNVQVPATEAEVLQDNGSKIKAFKTKWSCSFKPVPDVTQSTAVGNIYTRQKYKQWFNVDQALPGNNPEHGAVTAFITLPGANVVPGPAAQVTFNVYYKVSFSLRDPK